MIYLTSVMLVIFNFKLYSAR